MSFGSHQKYEYKFPFWLSKMAGDVIFTDHLARISLVFPLQQAKL
jgi:hypothetical protein